MVKFPDQSSGEAYFIAKYNIYLTVTNIGEIAVFPVPLFWPEFPVFVS